MSVRECAVELAKQDVAAGVATREQFRALVELYLDWLADKTAAAE